MLDLEPIWTAEIQQRNFRQLFHANAYPGRLAALNGVGDGARPEQALLASLLDAATSLADPHGLLSDDDWLRLQASKSHPESAAYVLCDALDRPDFCPSLGTLESPELGATLILKVPALNSGPLQLQMQGPGIMEKICRQVELNPEWFWQRAEWCQSFPLGVDLFLVDEQHVLAIPRTTKLEVL